jgi:hypothetical protein
VVYVHQPITGTYLQGTLISEENGIAKLINVALFIEISSSDIGATTHYGRIRNVSSLIAPLTLSKNRTTSNYHVACAMFPKLYMPQMMNLTNLHL